MAMQAYIEAQDSGNGAWFQYPIDRREVSERLGIRKKPDAYTITSCELPFDIPPNTDIQDFNRLCQLLDSEVSASIYPDVRGMIQAWFPDLDDFVSHVQSGEVVIFDDCYSMEDLAKHLIEQGMLGDIPEDALPYMDSNTYAEALKRDGMFYVGTEGVYRYNPTGEE